MWSQIQRKLYDLIDPNLKLQVHCAVYPGGGRTCLNGIPRFWVKLGGEKVHEKIVDVFSSDKATPEQVNECVRNNILEGADRIRAKIAQSQGIETNEA